MATLPKNQREAYLVALIHDSATWELAQLDASWMSRVLGAVLVDLATSGIQSFGMENKSLSALLDIDLSRPYEEARSAVVGAALSTASGTAYDMVNNAGANRIAVLRAALVRQYVTSRCGCAEPPLSDRLAPAVSLDSRLPPVRGTYLTPLGRLLASFDKPSADVVQALAGDRFRADEAHRVGSQMRALDAANRVAYFARLARDVESLHTELLDDQRSVSLEGLASSFATSLAAGGFGVGLTPAAGIALSALGSGALSADALSKERQVLLRMAALRRVVLDEIQRAPTACDCSPERLRPSTEAAAGDAAIATIPGGTYYYLSGRGVAAVTAARGNLSIEMTWTPTGDRYRLEASADARGRYVGTGQVVGHSEYINKAPPSAGRFSVELEYLPASQEILIRARTAAWGMDGLRLTRAAGPPQQ